VLSEQLQQKDRSNFSASVAPRATVAPEISSSLIAERFCDEMLHDLGLELSKASGANFSLGGMDLNRFTTSVRNRRSDF
jgi:hypothetical protein